MTEAQWLAGDDLVGMLTFVQTRTTNRKQRLFACGCCRGMWEAEPGVAVDRAIRIGYWHADEGNNDEQANRPAWEQVLQEGRAAGQAGDRMTSVLTFFAGSCLLKDPLSLFIDTPRRSVRGWLFELPWRVSRWLGGPVSTHEQVKERMRGWCSFARDVFGNPFRPAAVDPTWLTSTAVATARQMYESRDFSAMPILADALQDAGCECDDILSHCRGPGPHVRGCWVVDLVLGKT